MIAVLNFDVPGSGDGIDVLGTFDLVSQVLNYGTSSGVAVKMGLPLQGASSDHAPFEAVDIPVVALGEATMLYSCQLGQQSGIVTINPRFIPWFHHQIGKYGLRERVTGVHAMPFEPGQIMAGFESEENFENIMGLFTEQAKPLVASGCDVLIPGGGIPMLLFAKEHNHNVDGAPIINGIPIVTKMAEMAVKLRRLTGLHVSRTSDYIQPPPEIIEEFLNHPKGL